MNKSKLSNNEEIVLRLLYSEQLNSADIPFTFFGVEEKENLIRLKLINLIEKGKYGLTAKAIEIIETGGFIIKYPLHNENGVVMNFVDILQSYSKPALKALGISIINTKSFKKWGKFNNLKLFEELKEVIQYYDNFEHPTNKIKKYHNNIIEAQSIYEKVLIMELAKIASFKLINPLPLNMFYDENPIKLIEFKDLKEGTIKQGGLEILISFEDPQYKLTTIMMHQIIQQYYVVKSKAVKSVIVNENK